MRRVQAMVTARNSKGEYVMRIIMARDSLVLQFFTKIMILIMLN